MNGLLIGFLWFQMFSADLNGTVADSTGAILPSVAVKLTNRDTRLQRQVGSSENGEWRFLGLSPGVMNFWLEGTGSSLSSAPFSLPWGRRVHLRAKSIRQASSTKCRSARTRR